MSVEMLADELRAAVTELPWTWLDYLDLDEGVASVVGLRTVKVIWKTDGTVVFTDPNTGDLVGSFRVTVTVEEVKP